MEDYKVIETKEEESEIEGKVYQATDLNFRQDKKCKHSFKRKTSTRVECEKCHVGFFDNGDFPLEEMNLYYHKNYDVE